ncbi:hypothetical protein JCM15765_06640 [Paradesulfitobacterium aromaticivorans]
MDNEKEKNGLGEYLFHSLMPLKEAVMEVERQLIEESPEKVRQHLQSGRGLGGKPVYGRAADGAFSQARVNLLMVDNNFR